MSLALLICNCHSSETSGRKVLERAGLTDYMSVPCYKGRQAGRVYLDTYHDNADANVRSLKAYIANHTKYAVVVGFDGKRFEWADGLGGMESGVRAETIAQVFA